MIFVIFAKALPEWFYKSYYHCFTTIKFPKPSWRTPQSMIPSIANPTALAVNDCTVRVYSLWRFLPPRNTPDLFCRRFTRQNHRCAAWAVFFFFTNKILCSCSIFQNLFSVVDCTTSKCYSRAWKKPDVVSALRPAFFIPNLESFISRLNVILCHDLTLSVSEPDNAAAKLRSEQTVTPLHEQSPATYFLRLNNLEIFVELVGARPLHLLSQTVLPLKSPTGAFIAALRFANAVYAFWAQR